MAKKKVIPRVPNTLKFDDFQFVSPLDLEESCNTLENFPFRSQGASAEVYLTSVDPDHIRFAIRSSSEWGRDFWATGTLQRMEDNQTSIQGNTGMTYKQASLFVVFGISIVVTCCAPSPQSPPGSTCFLVGLYLFFALFFYMMISMHSSTLIKKLQKILRSQP